MVIGGKNYISLWKVKNFWVKMFLCFVRIQGITYHIILTYFARSQLHFKCLIIFAISVPLILLPFTISIIVWSYWWNPFFQTELVIRWLWMFVLSSRIWIAVNIIATVSTIKWVIFILNPCTGNGVLITSTRSSTKYQKEKYSAIRATYKILDLNSSIEGT